MHEEWMRHFRMAAMRLHRPALPRGRDEMLSSAGLDVPAMRAPQCKESIGNPGPDLKPFRWNHNVTRCAWSWGGHPPDRFAHDHPSRLAGNADQPRERLAQLAAR